MKCRSMLIQNRFNLKFVSGENELNSRYWLTIFLASRLQSLKPTDILEIRRQITKLWLRLDKLFALSTDDLINCLHSVLAKATASTAVLCVKPGPHWQTFFISVWFSFHVRIFIYRKPALSNTQLRFCSWYQTFMNYI